MYLQSGYTAQVYNSNIVESGGIGIALLNLTIPAGSFHTYLMTLGTNLKDETTSKLSILSCMCLSCFSFSTHLIAKC